MATQGVVKNGSDRVKHQGYLDGNQFFQTNCIPIHVTTVVHNQSVGTHAHGFCEFVFIEQGFSTHFCQGVTTILTPGDVFGIRPGDVHGYTGPRQTALYNCLFHPDALGRDVTTAASLPGVGPILDPDSDSLWQRVHLGPIERKEVQDVLQKMKWEQTQQLSGWELKLKGLLCEFLVSISRAFADQHRGEEPHGYRYTRHIHEALSFMEDNFDEGFNMEEIADHIGLSADYFSRLFKQFTGLSPLEYLKSIRLAKATELLQDSSKPIAAVALAVGFDDPSYFTRQFRQALGMSPSHYQKRFSGKESRIG